MSGMNPGFAAYLAKKNNGGGMSHDAGVAPMQPKGKAQPAAGVSNTAKQSYNNTKSSGGAKPQGKPHAKVMGNNPSKHGKYL